MKEGESKRARFDELVRGFDTAMLVTHPPDGGMRARPLSVASVDAEGDLWFSTGSNSGKVAELLGDPRVAIVMQGPSRFVSITGTAEIVIDSERAAALWQEAWRPWFPGGANDPELVLVHVRATEAEFWDLSGIRGLVYLFDAAKHAMTGERMTDGPAAHHDTVRLASGPAR